jgi:hypothetical protein
MPRVITIYEVLKGGFAITDQEDVFSREILLHACDSIERAGEFLSGMSGYVIQRPNATVAAMNLIACFSPEDTPVRKINMVKAVRNASGAGLKESKEAVDHAITIFNSAKT